MGFYQRWIVPPLIDLAMRNHSLDAYRQRTIMAASGLVWRSGWVRPEPAALQVGGRPRLRNRSLGGATATGEEECALRADTATP
jgi:hypothetical protein